MSARVLGVTPTSPGFKTMAIRPSPCSLTWAKGTVPTPHGNLSVSWKLAGDQFTLDVTVPAGTEADVILPGKTVHVKAGQHRFESAYKRVKVQADTKSGSATDSIWVDHISRVRTSP